MSHDDALTLSLRRDATMRHNATVTVTRVTGQTFDPDTGTYTDTTSTAYTGAALLLPVPSQEDTPEYGGEDVNTRRFRMQVAANTDVQVDDVVTVDTAGLDDDLAGKQMTVVDVAYSSRQVTRNVVLLYNVGG